MNLKEALSNVIMNRNDYKIEETIIKGMNKFIPYYSYNQRYWMTFGCKEKTSEIIILDTEEEAQAFIEEIRKRDLEVPVDRWKIGKIYNRLY